MRQSAYNKNMKKTGRYDMAQLFLALSNEVRLSLLNLIGEREVCVCELVAALDLPQPKISQHLACLRSAGVVEARREGRWMHYRILPPPSAEGRKVLQAALQWMQTDPYFQAAQKQVKKKTAAARAAEKSLKISA